MKLLNRTAQILLIMAIALIPCINHCRIVEADTSVLKWIRMDTPGSVTGKNDLVSPGEVNRIATGMDGNTFYSVDIANASSIDGSHALYKSVDGGISWTDELSQNLFQSMSPAERANFQVWNVTIARDNVNMIAVVTGSSVTQLPRNVWVSLDGGENWHDTNCPAAANISSIDILNYDSINLIAAGTRTGTGNGNVYILKTQNVSTWAQQDFTGDVMSLKFSPNFEQDNSLIAIYSSSSGTYLNAGIYDVQSNSSIWNTVYGIPPEVTSKSAGTSPTADQIISADLELPSDFQAQSPSFRRYYLSIDAPVDSAGIFRIDDNVIYWLMPATNSKRISSLAYFGTCHSGKLLAGEVLGNPCTAAVMTWFTDAPVTCPDTCWYPSSKPPTGAAGIADCTGSGYGNAQVAWSPDGQTAYAGTSSSGVLVAGADWPIPYLTGTDLDESAFSTSRNNGASWNQLSLIDTAINRLIDIAPSPDCSNIYLASINNDSGCRGFDSVWHSSTGNMWERILCKPTAQSSCASGQSDNAILKLAEDKVDGQVIFWSPYNSKIVMWSPDYGDFWFTINTGLRVQDFAAEDSTRLYVLEDTGLVQKLNYSGKSWVSAETVSSGLDTGYSIASAFAGNTPDNHKGTIIVGAKNEGRNNVSCSTDGGETFSAINKHLPTGGNTVVIASSSFNSDGTILAINAGGMYAWGIYQGEQDWQTWWGGIEFPSPVTGLAISRNYGFYLSTPATPWSQATPYIRWYSAIADLDPGISLGTAEEPGRKIRICGGLESGENITVYIIDQRDYVPPQGGIWYYVDDLAWNGPLPVSPVSRNSVSFDPVTGRAGQIDLSWKPVSLSKGYRIQISRDSNFIGVIADIGKEWGVYYTPYDLDNPALIVPPGGGEVTDRNGNEWKVPSLVSGHTYYWRVKVQDVLTGDSIPSPWSWTESFIVTQGLPVN